MCQRPPHAPCVFSVLLSLSLPLAFDWHRVRLLVAREDREDEERRVKTQQARKAITELNNNNDEDIEGDTDDDDDESFVDNMFSDGQ